jgi:N-formylglutamate amidohydrolase
MIQRRSKSYADVTKRFGIGDLMNATRLAILLGLVFLATSTARAEEPKTKPTDLISAQQGQLPIILSAPHGGLLPIPGVAVRKGDGLEKGPRGFVTVRDSGTEELAHDIADAVAERIGKKPYFVIARFERKYADPNRPPDIAYEDPNAKPTYDAYHTALAQYCREIHATFDRGLLLDVHGQGAKKDTIFRGTKEGKTCELLIKRFGQMAHVGPESFFGLMAGNGLTGYPLDAGKEQSGFGGGYIVQTYGGDKEFGLDAIQLEFGADYRSKENRKQTAANLAKVIEAYAKLYLPEKPVEKKKAG